MNGLMLLAVLVALLLLQSALTRRFALKRLTYERRFDRAAATEGEETELIEVIRNRKLLPVPYVRAESRLSPHLRFRSDGETQITGERYHKSVFYLRPYCQITRRHTVRLLKRGCYRAGAVALTAGDLMGMSAPTAQLDTGAAIEVYPKALDPEELNWPSLRWQGEMVVRRWIVNDPVWVCGIRPYAPGDDPKDIHWKATARMGALQVKAHDQTADPKLMVVFNAQMSEHQWADLMEYEQQVVERMISLTAGLCLRALRSGVEAGFAANIPLDKGEEPAILPPSRGCARETELLSAMAHLTIQKTRTFLYLLDRLAVYTGMDIVLLSVYDSELIQARINILRLMGNTVTLVLISRQEMGEGGAGLAG